MDQPTKVAAPPGALSVMDLMQMRIALAESHTKLPTKALEDAIVKLDHFILIFANGLSAKEPTQ